MKQNISEIGGIIRIAMKNQFAIQGKCLNKDDVIATALYEFIKEQENTLKKICKDVQIKAEL